MKNRADSVQPEFFCFLDADLLLIAPQEQRAPLASVSHKNSCSRIPLHPGEARHRITPTVSLIADWRKHSCTCKCTI
jgi:hypothetical protein